MMASLSAATAASEIVVLGWVNANGNILRVIMTYYAHSSWVDILSTSVPKKISPSSA